MEALILLVFVAVGGLVLAPVFSMVAVSRARERADRMEARLELLEHSREVTEASLRRTQRALEALQAEVARANLASQGARIHAASTEAPRVSSAPDAPIPSVAREPDRGPGELGRAAGVIWLPAVMAPDAARDIASADDVASAKEASVEALVAGAAPPPHELGGHTQPASPESGGVAPLDTPVNTAALSVLPAGSAPAASPSSENPSSDSPSADGPGVDGSGSASPRSDAPGGGIPGSSIASGDTPGGTTPSTGDHDTPGTDWERWIGVRGAAVLGGAVLALAAILFFRYAVERGLLPPIVRVVMGTLLGVGAVFAGERLRARYEVTANALAGAGLVALYAAFWAARVSYELIGMEVAFVLMALTTAAGCLLAARHGSLLIAVLVLVGGFATPLLLSSGSDRPIGLFGYILLLDAGFVLVARKRGWGVLLALALAGTLLIEALWIGLRMGSERVALGAAVVVVFAVLFALAGAPPAAASESDGARGWWQTRAAAVILSLGFALYFASQARLGVRLVPVAGMLGVLSFGAGWVARREARAGWLPLAAAVASVTVVAVWCGGATLTPALTWELGLCAAGLGLVFQLGGELSREKSDGFIVSALAQLGLLATLIAAAVASPLPHLVAWLTGALVLVAALAWTGDRAWRGYPALAAGALLGFGLLSFQSEHRFDVGVLGRVGFFELELALAAALSLPSLLRRSRADHALAAVFPAALLIGLCLIDRRTVFAGAPASLAFVAGLGMLAVFALTRAGDVRRVGAAYVLLVLAQHQMHREPEGNTILVLAILALTLAFAAGWPLLVQRALRPARWVPIVSALAAPLWFLDLRRAWLGAFGPEAIGLLPIALLPIALGALSLVVLWQLRRTAALPEELRRGGLASYAALALGFASVAIPLQLDRQWITLGLALESAAVLFLFRRIDHAGLKWFGIVLATAVTARLVLNPAVLDYEARGWPILNWLLYTYWVPALALLGGHVALRDIELRRARPWEAGLYAKRHPVGALALGGAVVAVLFVWLNLAIFDAFAEGTTLTIDLERRPSRDLTLSLGWAAYAGVLSAIGMLKRSRGLRWVSLAIWLLTVGKVFLYDLGQLRDLYRVLSLLGLAVSLIAISLAYQRYVFNDKSRKGSA